MLSCVPKSTAGLWERKLSVDICLSVFCLTHDWNPDRLLDEISKTSGDSRKRHVQTKTESWSLNIVRLRTFTLLMPMRPWDLISWISWSPWNPWNLIEHGACAGTQQRKQCKVSIVRRLCVSVSQQVVVGLVGGVTMGLFRGAERTGIWIKPPQIHQCLTHRGSVVL